MVRKLDAADFRAARRVLEPSDFALSDDTPDNPPTDLIDKAAWRGIMDLPDDVAVRTTSHQGSRVAVLHALIGAWTKAYPPDGIIAHAMLDGFDSFQAAAFNLVHGFYKEAIAALRNALETQTFAISCQLSNDKQAWDGWLTGNELSFKRECDRVQGLPPLDGLETHAGERSGTSIFAGQDGSGRNAWARNLYRRLSEYAHARGTNTSLWESTGPIYSAKGFALAYHQFLETFALTVILAKVAEPTVSPGAARCVFTDENRAQYLDAAYSQVCGLYVERLF